MYIYVKKKAAKPHPVPQMSIGGVLGGIRRKHGHDI